MILKRYSKQHNKAHKKDRAAHEMKSVSNRGASQQERNKRMKDEPKQKLVKSLRAKLAEIVADIGPVEKKGKHSQFMYTKVGQVYSELKHRLSERGIYFHTEVVSFRADYHDKSVLGTVKTLHTFTDTETGEELTLRGGGSGWDFSDKWLYKAVTGAAKSILMVNFLITDEVEPESGDQAPTPKSDDTRHTRTKPYEEKTPDGDHKATTDLLELKAFLTEHEIADGFLIALLQEKKLIDGRTKTVATIQPGILRRILATKSKDNLLTAWKQHENDEAKNFTPSGNPLPKEKKDTKEEVRTREGDQTRALVRKPVQDDITPADILEQDGYTNWRKVAIHWGDDKGKLLGTLTTKNLHYFVTKWEPQPHKGTWNDKDLLLDAALCLASAEMAGAE